MDPSPGGSDVADYLSSVMTSSRQRIIPTACRRCHSRKVKCSGGKPCKGCKEADKVSECTYPHRQRLIKVDQDHLINLVEEVKRLRTHQNDHSPHGKHSAQNQPRRADSEAAQEGTPTIDQSHWFFNADRFRTPIFLGEAADACFATRVCQVVSNRQRSHIPRTNYPNDEELLSVSNADCAWPTPIKGRALIGSALRSFNEYFCIVRKSQVWEDFQSLTGNFESRDAMSRSKLWALFALGELYSSRGLLQGKRYPGLDYFAKATRVLRVVYERPSLDAIELRLLLAIYSLSINRRHSSYDLAGSAVRQAIIIGLHFNIPKSQLADECTREHRNRVWWAAYMIDRICAANFGNPVGVGNEVINASLPSDLEQPAGDFCNATYLKARIELVGLRAEMTDSIYARRAQSSSQKSPLVQRVREGLSQLADWKRNLPSELCLEHDAGGQNRPTVTSLHLAFHHECAIVTIRPILVFALRIRVSSLLSPLTQKQSNSSDVSEFVDTCVQHVRDATDLLLESWSSGAYATFDYFYTQYLFSASTILCLTRLLGIPDHDQDSERFDAAFEVLSQLKTSGHLAASEFHRHVEAIKTDLSDLDARLRGEYDPLGAETLNHADSGAANTGAFIPPLPPSFSSVQDGLPQPDANVQFIDDFMFSDILQGMYWSGNGNEV